MDTSVYISGLCAIIAIICLVKINKASGTVSDEKPAKAAPAAASKAAAPAAAPAAGKDEVVAAIVAAIACMGSGEVASISPAKNTGWTTAARIAGTTPQF